MAPHPDSKPPPPPPPPDTNTTLANFRAETIETWLALASMSDTLGSHDRAIDCYRKVLDYDPSNTKALVGTANQYRAKELFAKAIDYYNSALKLDPNDGSVCEALAHCYLMVDNLNESYTAYQRALNTLPDQNVPKLWYGIAILYDRCGSFDLAKNSFLRVLEIDANYSKKSDIYFRLGIIYKHEHDYHHALDNFYLVLKNPPPPLAISDIWFQIGHIQETLEDYSHAQYAYERVLEDNPAHAKVLQQLGWLHFQQYMKGLPPSPQQPPAATATTNSNPDSPQAASEQTLNLAINRLNASLDIEPNDPYTWYLLGRVYVQAGRHDQAFRAYERAIALDPSNARFLCSIGIFYYRTGSFHDALRWYTKSITADPDTLSEAWYNAAILYQISNQLNDAINAMENAIRVDPHVPLYKSHLDYLTSPATPKDVIPDELKIAREPPVAVDRPLPTRIKQEGSPQMLDRDVEMNGHPQQQGPPPHLQHGGPPGPPGPNQPPHEMMDHKPAALQQQGPPPGPRDMHPQHHPQHHPQQQQQQQQHHPDMSPHQAYRRGPPPPPQQQGGPPPPPHQQQQPHPLQSPHAMHPQGPLPPGLPGPPGPPPHGMHYGSPPHQHQQGLSGPPGPPPHHPNGVAGPGYIPIAPAPGASPHMR